MLNRVLPSKDVLGPYAPGPAAHPPNTLRPHERSLNKWGSRRRGGRLIRSPVLLGMTLLLKLVLFGTSGCKSILFGKNTDNTSGDFVAEFLGKQI
jgi:hypothetical protein